MWAEKWLVACLSPIRSDARAFYCENRKKERDRLSSRYLHLARTPPSPYLFPSNLHSSGLSDLFEERRPGSWGNHSNLLSRRRRRHQGFPSPSPMSLTFQFTRHVSSWGARLRIYLLPAIISLFLLPHCLSPSRRTPIDCFFFPSADISANRNKSTAEGTTTLCVRATCLVSAPVITSISSASLRATRRKIAH